MVRQRRAQFVALISRDDNPLYIQSFNLEPADSNDSGNANKFLKYNFLSHMALDIFSSPASISIREQQQRNNDGVLLLFIQDDVTVYGYESNNGLKIVIGFGKEEPNEEQTELEEEMGDSAVIVDQKDLKDLFSQVRKCYLKTLCNPFTNLDFSEGTETILQSPTFDKRITKIIEEWNDMQ
ncbi:uncharacterized protein PRCAT00005342001 [Priceomyces carsonii]|uniref:uncharacterized protein n=1 Tax=Priceomyces carsonii TaxID=28549 RepID=UPI002ED92C07|nr:unnamed protein product [Priceomyces carsonii]